MASCGRLASPKARAGQRERGSCAGAARSLCQGVVSGTGAEGGDDGPGALEGRAPSVVAVPSMKARKRVDHGRPAGGCGRTFMGLAHRRHGAVVGAMTSARWMRWHRLHWRVRYMPVASNFTMAGVMSGCLVIGDCLHLLAATRRSLSGGAARAPSRLLALRRREHPLVVLGDDPVHRLHQLHVQERDVGVAVLEAANAEAVLEGEDAAARPPRIRELPPRA